MCLRLGGRKVGGGGCRFYGSYNYRSLVGHDWRLILPESARGGTSLSNDRNSALPETFFRSHN